MKYYSLLLLLIICFSCKQNETLTEAYKEGISSYRIKKNGDRKKGYLQLTGLHKLGITNTFGKDTTNSIVVKAVDIPANIGTILITDSLSTFTSNTNILVKDKNDSLVTQTTLNYDEYGSSQKLFQSNINWQVITRSGSKYLRIWDTKNPAIEAFKGFEYFDLNPDLILQGEFTYYEDVKNEKVGSRLGVNTSTNFIGKVTFDYNSNSYSLDVGNNGFTMVADATNDDTSYSGGRYVYLNLPEKSGSVTLDFNKLYNPPCSFSEYTTCLYPPRQNHLPFKIEAGETITPNY